MNMWEGWGSVQTLLGSNKYLKHALVVPGRRVTGPGLKLTARSQSIQLLWAQAQSNFRVFFIKVWTLSPYIVIPFWNPQDHGSTIRLFSRFLTHQD